MAAGVVAAATTMPVSTLPSSHARGKSMVVSSFSFSLLQTNPEFSRSHLHVVNPLLRPGPFSSWSGLKHLGVYFRRSESKGRCRGRMVYASLFGVGAPEALVIGVVALLVFGPKGLAEVARNLGKTLRAFQPTIRELQDVSREFRSTLEREIGLDEVQSSLNSTISPDSPVTNKPQTPVDSNGAQSIKEPSTSENFPKQTQEQMISSATTSQTQGTATECTTSNAPPIDAATSVTSEETTTADSPAGSAASEASPVANNQEAKSDPTVAITDKDGDLNRDATNV